MKTIPVQVYDKDGR